MRRYFYDSPAIISKWLEKNAFAKSYEDSLYRSAFLSAIRNNRKEQLKNLREKILDMSMGEQQKYAGNQHIQHLFTLFHNLYKHSRGRQMIVDGNTSNGSTELVDPDKFPIWDLKKYTPIYRSLWPYYLSNLRFNMGFQSIIRESQVEHEAGGRGVYLITSLKQKSISAGEFLGLVPGRIFANFLDYKRVALKNKKQYHRQPQHLHFPSGKILQLGDISLKSKQPFGLDFDDSAAKVDATYHNPYAFGHMINHPPPGYQSNVCFTQMNISVNYFPKHLLRYLPYQDLTMDNKNITLFGIFSLKQIQHKQQLFVNYNESHIYPIDNLPEWMIEPHSYSQIFKYLKKGEYQLTESSYWKYIEKKALEKNKGLLEKYQSQNVQKPDVLQFQDSQRRYKKLKIRTQDDNKYEHM